jgi:hypothetical protein
MVAEKEVASVAASAGTLNTSWPTTSSSATGEGEGEARGAPPGGAREVLAEREARAVPVEVSVAVAVAGAEGVAHAVLEADREAVPVAEGGLEAEADHVHMQEQKAVCVGLREDPAEGVPAAVSEGLREGPAEGEPEADAKPEGVPVGVRAVSLGCALGLAGGEGEEGGVPVVKPDCAGEGVGAPVALSEGLGEEVSGEEAVGAAVPVPAAVAEGAPLTVEEEEEEKVEEAVALAVALSGVAVPV